MKQFLEVDTVILNNTYGSFVAAKLFFELGQIINKSVGNKDHAEWKMFPLSRFCIRHRLALNQTRLDELNSRFRSDFGTLRSRRAPSSLILICGRYGLVY